MQTLAERFFTGAEQQRITAAVQAVEARTSGEVVVMVTSASHGCPEAGLLAAAALALPAALATAFTTAGLLWWRGEVLWLFLLLFTLFFALLRPLVGHFPSLLRLFLRGIRDDDAAGGLRLGVDTLHHDAVVEGTKLRFCHDAPRWRGAARADYTKLLLALRESEC